MIVIKGMLIKQFEDNRSHFIERVAERYGIIITEDDYEKLCCAFQGVFKKSGHKTIGYIIIDDVKVWCLYMNEEKWLTTAYPKEIETNAEELIKACFSKPIRPLAFFVYQTYLEEIAKIRNDFETVKDAAIYFFTETLFPPLHIDQYKYGSVKPFKVINQIDNLLRNKSRYVRFSIERLPLEVRGQKINTNGSDVQ